MICFLYVHDIMYSALSGGTQKISRFEFEVIFPNLFNFILDHGISLANINLDSAVCTNAVLSSSE